MKKIVFISDIHLDHLLNKREPLDYTRILSFCDAVKAKNPEGIILTGDITVAPYIKEHLGLLTTYIPNVPIYFVAGNHDYYLGGFASTEMDMREVCKAHKNLIHLTDQTKAVPLSDKTCLVGAEGWYDGGYANWFAPGIVIMADYFHIKEFKHLTQNELFDCLQVQAKRFTRIVKAQIEASLSDYKKIIIATHIPPFRQASTYQGRISNNNWMPCFSSKIMGDMILEMAHKYPKKEFKVLAGHSHGRSDYVITKNLSGITSRSEYGMPELSIQELEIE